MYVKIGTGVYLQPEHVMGVISYDNLDTASLQRAIRLNTGTPRTAILMTNGNVLLVDRLATTVLEKLASSLSNPE